MSKLFALNKERVLRIDTYITINLPKMLTYQVKISSEEWLKNEKAPPHA